jgi:hypothetical protein
MNWFEARFRWQLCSELQLYESCIFKCTGLGLFVFILQLNKRTTQVIFGLGGGTAGAIFIGVPGRARRRRNYEKTIN